MSMASVIKVAVMLTTMDQAIREERDLTSWELQQLRPMITESDNDATTALWDELGGGAAIEAYLRSIGVTDIVPNSSDYWGASRASAKAVALLFAKIAFSDILDQPKRQLALELLSEVIPSQRWGVTAGVPDEQPPGTVIGLKDGWYPARYAWWVNSAGILVPGDARPAYAIAVLTRGQPSWEYGIETIEGVAERIYTALNGAP
ncbi:MAG: serine hydrolase, partial [Chloroflexi bacterium]|nr:serine hydrolase [Chloroflexota bacterium]